MSTIKEIHAMDDKDVIKSVTGRLTKLYDPNKGGTENKTWELQNGELTDEAGDKIKITFSKCSQPSSAKNCVITVKAVKTDAHGWNGCKAEDKSFEKNGETINERVVWVTPSAEISYAGAAPKQDTAQPQQSKTQAGQPTNSPASNLSQMNRLENLVDLYYHSFRLVDQAFEPIEMNDGERENLVRTSATTVFIEASRTGLAAFWDKDKSDEKPPEKKKEFVAPSDPKKWRECILPSGEFVGKTLAELPRERLAELHIFLDERKTQTPFAECVYQAAIDLELFKKPELAKKDTELDSKSDMIPF